MMNGRVIGGHFLNAAVTTAPVGSALVVQSGLKWRKLNPENVAQWEEVAPESKSGPLSAVGQAVAGAVVPRIFSKTASAAVGATLDTAMRPARIVRIDWADGKQSLVKLPDKLFVHLELVLKARLVAEPDRSAAEPSVPVADVASATLPSVSEQAFSLAAGFLKDRRSAQVTGSTAGGETDIADQIVRLASLRDAGVLTEDEFTTKKAELLSRM